MPKTYLISGADSGIGRAVSVLFAREGAKVAIAYLDEDTDAQETAKLVEDEGSEALLIPGDLGGKAHCEEVAATVVGHFGQLDIVRCSVGRLGRARQGPVAGANHPP